MNRNNVGFYFMLACLAVALIVAGVVFSAALI